MQGVLHFPFIQVPQAAWFARSLLYWDQVGTIVPKDWIEAPHELGEYTQDLVQRGLVRQVFPEEAGDQLGTLFEQWLSSLDKAELAARKESFKRGQLALIHVSKWLLSPAGLRSLVGLRLAKERDDQWIAVESKTANDFMAALALSLCDPKSELHAGERCLWVPSTADPAAGQSLLDGLVQLDREPQARTLQLRVEGEVQASEIRLSVLEQALPLPDEALTPDLIERIRSRHGDALPACRRRVEKLVDDVLAQPNPALQVRMLDRVRSEVDDLVAVAEAYLQESGVRRIARAPLIRMLKAAPVAGRAADALQDTAASLETATRLQNEPLAYLALARAEMNAGRYRAARAMPLIEQFAS
jgi:hypothetical protein